MIDRVELDRLVRERAARQQRIAELELAHGRLANGLTPAEHAELEKLRADEEALKAHEARP